MEPGKATKHFKSEQFKTTSHLKCKYSSAKGYCKMLQWDLCLAWPHGICHGTAHHAQWLLRRLWHTVHKKTRFEKMKYSKCQTSVLLAVVLLPRIQCFPEPSIANGIKWDKMPNYLDTDWVITLHVTRTNILHRCSMSGFTCLVDHQGQCIYTSRR